MDNVTDRLTKCFSLVFPNLSKSAIPTADAAQLSEWDSVAQLNLLSVIGEEFGMDIDFEEFEGATSFPTLLNRVQEIRGRG